MTLYESFRDKIKYNQHCLILAVFKRGLEVEKSWKNILRVNWVGSHFKFFFKHICASIYIYLCMKKYTTYIHILLKKKIIKNLFIIITMNKKKTYSTHKTQDRLCWYCCNRYMPQVKLKKLNLLNTK